MSNSNKYTKQFIGSGKKHDTYDIVYTRLYVDKFESLLKTDQKSGRKYLDLNVGSKREKDQYGNTHGVWVNVLNEQHQQPQYQGQQQTQQVQSFNIDDAPF